MIGEVGHPGFEDRRRQPNGILCFAIAIRNRDRAELAGDGGFRLPRLLLGVDAAAHEPEANRQGARTYQREDGDDGSQDDLQHDDQCGIWW